MVDAPRLIVFIRKDKLFIKCTGVLKYVEYYDILKKDIFHHAFIVYILFLILRW